MRDFLFEYVIIHKEKRVRNCYFYNLCIAKQLCAFIN